MSAKILAILGALFAAELCGCAPPRSPPEQLAVGFNGPASHRRDVFRSEQELRSSWVAHALSQNQLDGVIDATDFSQNVLVALSLGPRENASGQVSISELTYDDRMPGYYISVRIGVVPESCGVPFTHSYPFVLGLAPIANSEAEVTGYVAQNLGDTCGPIMEGEPTSVPE